MHIQRRTQRGGTVQVDRAAQNIRGYTDGGSPADREVVHIERMCTSISDSQLGHGDTAAPRDEVIRRTAIITTAPQIHLIGQHESTIYPQGSHTPGVPERLHRNADSALNRHIFGKVVTIIRRITYDCSGGIRGAGFATEDQRTVGGIQSGIAQRTAPCQLKRAAVDIDSSHLHLRCSVQCSTGTNRCRAEHSQLTAEYVDSHPVTADADILRFHAGLLHRHRSSSIKHCTITGSKGNRSIAAVLRGIPDGIRVVPVPCAAGGHISVDGGINGRVLETLIRHFNNRASRQYARLSEIFHRQARPPGHRLTIAEDDVFLVQLRGKAGAELHQRISSQPNGATGTAHRSGITKCIARYIHPRPAAEGDIAIVDDSGRQRHRAAQGQTAALRHRQRIRSRHVQRTLTDTGPRDTQTTPGERERTLLRDAQFSYPAAGAAHGDISLRISGYRPQAHLADIHRAAEMVTTTGDGESLAPGRGRTIDVFLIGHRPRDIDG